MPTTPTPPRETNDAQQHSFRVYLQQELLRRCDKNRGYSLRAFARALAIDPSSLARILKGERAISARMKERLGERLGLSPRELARFLHTDRPRKANRFDQLSLDAFQVICDWYHFAILELVKLKNFKSSSRWIATRLGLTATEVNVAVERLIRLGLLQKVAGELLPTSENRTILSGQHTSQAQRKLQKQVLEMALSALEEVPLEKRSQTSMTMAVSTRRLPEAIERIRSFRRELSTILEQDPDRDEVYQLSVSLYPVTTQKGENNS